MNRCSTCKFWSDKDESLGWEGTAVGMRQCTRALERWTIMDQANGGAKFCGSDDPADEAAWGQRRVDALRQSMVYVQDGSEYRAEMITAPDFGCVLHQHA